MSGRRLVNELKDGGNHWAVVPCRSTVHRSDTVHQADSSVYSSILSHLHGTLRILSPSCSARRTGDRHRATPRWRHPSRSSLTSRQISPATIITTPNTTSPMVIVIFLVRKNWVDDAHPMCTL